MGMTGALPKEDAVRKRSIDPIVGWVDLPPEGRQGPIPKLPPSPWNEGKWSDRAIDHWHRLWTSPQATQWDDSKPEVIWRYVCLYERGYIFDWDGPMYTEAGKIEAMHGLTPHAMRRMFWRIKPSEDKTVNDHLAPVQSIKKEREELR